MSSMDYVFYECICGETVRAYHDEQLRDLTDHMWEKHREWFIKKMRRLFTADESWRVVPENRPILEPKGVE